MYINVNYYDVDCKMEHNMEQTETYLSRTYKIWESAKNQNLPPPPPSSSIYALWTVSIVYNLLSAKGYIKKS